MTCSRFCLTSSWTSEACGLVDLRVEEDDRVDLMVLGGCPDADLTKSDWTGLLPHRAV
jgi:hypothetical protein